MSRALSAVACPIVTLVASLTVMSACAGGSIDTEPAPDATSGSAPTTTTPTTSDDATTDATTTTTTARTITAAPEETTDGEPVTAAELLGLPKIEVSTPGSGGGTQPVLEWVAVDGADRYVLIVHDPTGAPYWAWEGTSNSIRLGGSTASSDDGPQLMGAQTWQVMAFDSSGIAAASPVTAISP